MSIGDSVNTREEYQKLRAMEQYHWTSIKSFWMDNQDDDQVLKEIIEQKRDINKKLNDLQMSLMQSTENRQKTKDLTLFISVICDNK